MHKSAHQANATQDTLSTAEKDRECLLRVTRVPGTMVGVFICAAFIEILQQIPRGRSEIWMSESQSYLLKLSCWCQRFSHSSLPHTQSASATRGRQFFLS